MLSKPDDPCTITELGGSVDFTLLPLLRENVSTATAGISTLLTAASAPETLAKVSGAPSVAEFVMRNYRHLHAKNNADCVNATPCIASTSNFFNFSYPHLSACAQALVFTHSHVHIGATILADRLNIP